MNLFTRTARLVRSSPRRVATLLSLTLALVVGVAAWESHGSAATAAAPAGFTATRGDLTVTVGGVGQIVQAGQSSQPTQPVAATGTVPAPETPGFSVFPQTSGKVTVFLVSPGRHVAAGQPLALLNDGGVAAAGIGQAQIDVTSARLELRQKRTNDPSKGIRPAPAEFSAAHAAVTSARARLARLLASPRAADVSTARLDVKRAKADLETSLGGTPAVRADAILIARQGVELAQRRLDKVLAPPHPADVAAAEADVLKAEAELATLQRPSFSASPEALLAAKQAVSFARQDLAAAQRTEDREQIRAAQEALDSALSDLAALLVPGPAALPSQIAAAQSAIDAARAKLERLLSTPSADEVTAAHLELKRAQADLRLRLSGPSSAALDAGRQAVDATTARLQQLLAPPLRSDVALARLEVRRAEAEVAVLRARRGPASPTDIELARLKVDAAQGRLSSALLAAGPLTVRAPRAGTVTSLLTTLGAHVDPPTPVLAMADLGHLEARVDLSEFDIAQVQRGQRASVSVDALGGKAFPGDVRFAALAGTNTSGVVTFPVQVAIGVAPRLKPGMNVSVRIVVAKRHNVVQLPLEAVTQEAGEATVIVLGKSGKPVSHGVELGLANNKKVEIVKGLRAGQRVVLEGNGGGGE